MRRRYSVTLLALVLVSIVSAPVAAHDAGAVETSGDYAEIDMAQAGVWDVYNHAGWYADYIFANSDLDRCRSRANVVAEIKAHAIAYALDGTDPVAGLTCDRFLD